MLTRSEGPPTRPRQVELYDLWATVAWVARRTSAVALRRCARMQSGGTEKRKGGRNAKAVQEQVKCTRSSSVQARGISDSSEAIHPVGIPTQRAGADALGERGLRRAVFRFFAPCATRNSE